MGDARCCNDGRSAIGTKFDYDHDFEEDDDDSVVFEMISLDNVVIDAERHIDKENYRKCKNKLSWLSFVILSVLLVSAATIVLIQTNRQRNTSLDVASEIAKNRVDNQVSVTDINFNESQSLATGSNRNSSNI